jgi:coiled-coil and C2 domain-containing protein 2A
MEQVVVDILDDDRQRDVSVHQRYERHWLGGFKIPFQVVCKWSKVYYSFPYKSKLNSNLTSIF